VSFYVGRFFQNSELASTYVDSSKTVSLLLRT